MRGVPVDEFVSAMSARWVAKLGNVSSEPLRATWRQMGDAFNEHIDHACPPWTILQPATGTGKSQGAVVYISLLSKRRAHEHPGVLLVTRLKAEADALAAQTNELSGRIVAAAYHSDTKGQLSVSALPSWPVLVITHAAFLGAVDPKAPSGNSWGALSAWQSDERRLVIIDEALDMVSEISIDLDGLRQTQGAIPEWARQECKADMRILNDVIVLMERGKFEGQRERVIAPDDVLTLIGTDEAPTFSALLKQLPCIPFDIDALHREDHGVRGKLRRMHARRIVKLRDILVSWVLLARQQSKHTLNTARLLLPSTGRGAVVLDATAGSDLVYELFGTLPLPAPAGARSYANVTIHLSEGHRLGKRYLRDNAASEAHGLMESLARKLAPGRRVFVCCHKDVEAQLTGHGVPFTVSTGHWGAVDGSNAWQDCDVGVIFGLPYLPDTRPVNVFFALRGAQPTAWLQSDAKPFGEHLDVRKALRHSHMVVSIVQAINRTQCRRVVDEFGNCAPTDIYLPLPADKELSEAILTGIRRSMPGVQFAEWSFSGAVRRKAHQPKRTNHQARLLKHLENMLPGRVALARVRSALRIPAKAATKLVTEARDAATEISAALVSLGVTVEVQGAGRGSRVTFVKA